MFKKRKFILAILMLLPSYALAGLLAPPTGIIGISGADVSTSITSDHWFVGIPYPQSSQSTNSVTVVTQNGEVVYDSRTQRNDDATVGFFLPRPVSPLPVITGAMGGTALPNQSSGQLGLGLNGPGTLSLPLGFLPIGTPVLLVP